MISDEIIDPNDLHFLEKHTDHDKVDEQVCDEEDEVEEDDDLRPHLMIQMISDLVLMKFKCL